MSIRTRTDARPRGPRARTAMILALGTSMLGACATSLRVPDREATTAAGIAATPNAEPRRTITSFTESLRCMDDKLQQYQITGILLGLQEVADINSEVAGTKDMLLTSLSTMSRKSKAFGVVTLGGDQGDVSEFYRLHGTQQFRAPDYFVRLSTPQIDKGVQVAQIGGGLRAAGVASAEASTDRIASVISLDMNLGLVQNLQLLPGIYSSNSVAVVRKGDATDVGAEIQKMGAVFRISNDNSEGFHHSVRTLIELGAIELVGRLTQTPYWECLDIDSTNPAVQAQVQDWYAGLDDTERTTFVQGKLAALERYGGPVDGTDSADLHTAIATYKAETGLIADGEIDFLLYYRLVVDPTPVAPSHLKLLDGADAPLVAATSLGGDAAARGPAALGGERLVPLEMTMTTDRGTKPVVYRQGEQIRLSVDVTADAHVYCYYRQGDGAVVKLFPNRFRPYARIAGGETLELPGKDRFQIKTDRAGQAERLMCLASYDDIDAKLPFQLREKDLQPLPVGSLDEVDAIYRKVAATAPLRQTIDVEVVR